MFCGRQVFDDGTYVKLLHKINIDQYPITMHIVNYFREFDIILCTEASLELHAMSSAPSNNPHGEVSMTESENHGHIMLSSLNGSVQRVPCVSVRYIPDVVVHVSKISESTASGKIIITIKYFVQ